MAKHAKEGFFNKFSSYYKLSSEEIKAFVISIIAMAFIISFDKWGEGDAFNFLIGIINLFKSIIIVFIVLGIQIMVAKIYSLKCGYRAEYKLWWYGILIGLILAFFSASLTNKLGKTTIILFLAPGGIFFHHLAARRLGEFRYGVNQWETGVTCMFSSFSSIILAVIFKMLIPFFPGTFLYDAMVISLWFAFFSMLPIPPLNGSRAILWSRLTYAFIFGIIIGFNFLLRFDINMFLVILFALISGVIIWGLILWKVES